MLTKKLTIEEQIGLFGEIITLKKYINKNLMKKLRFLIGQVLQKNMILHCQIHY